MVCPYYNSKVRFFLAAAFTLCLPGAAWAQIDPKAAILETSGFDALRAGQFERAITSFQEGLAGDPTNPRLHLGLGLAAFGQQRDAAAKTELDRALELAPGLTEAREVLGLILHRQGDLFGAIRSYETLMAAVPSDAAAADRLEEWRRELELGDRMEQTVGEHFTVSFEGPAEAELADKAVESLERAYWRIGPLLGVYPTSAVSVVLYTGEQFRDITRSPSWAAAAYDGTIRVPMRGALDNPDELDRVLAHELTHALVHTLAPRAIPTWLNEGLAAALESPDLSWARTALRTSGRTIPLGRLASSFRDLNARDATLAYAASAIAVGRLLDEIGGVGVANLIRDLGEGADFEASFAHRAQQSFSDFTARLGPP
jgi:tetratricopeptide (TPR) repeat protein